MVPPCSDRMARVPPYSRTCDPGFPYGAVTRSGPPFQTLPVPKTQATGLVRVRSPLLAESRLMSFPPATEMFQFAGFASCAYEFSCRIPVAGWVAPFGDPGINDRSHLPRAFRSVPRPSSPLSAKASTRCPYFALERHTQRQGPFRRHQESDAAQYRRAQVRQTLLSATQASLDAAMKTLLRITRTSLAAAHGLSAYGHTNSLLHDCQSTTRPGRPDRRRRQLRVSRRVTATRRSASLVATCRLIAEPR